MILKCGSDCLAILITNRKATMHRSIEKFRNREKWIVYKSIFDINLRLYG